MENQDIRWQQRFKNFEKSFLLLKQTVQIKKPFSSPFLKVYIISIIGHKKEAGEKEFCAIRAFDRKYAA